MNKNKLIIMRGVTGAGKTTLLHGLWPEAVVCSADAYFKKQDMPWDYRLLEDAHDDCFNDFDDALTKGSELVVIDNTNVKREHYLDYATEGLAADYAVLFFHVMCNPKVAAARSKHRANINLDRLYHQHRLVLQQPEIHGTTSVYVSPWKF